MAAQTSRKVRPASGGSFRGRRPVTSPMIDLTALGDALVWEPSRGGALFPHLYGPLPVSAVTRVQAMSVSDTGEVTLGAGAA